MTRREKDLAELRNAMKTAAKLPWRQRFDNLVRLGVIDEQGRYLGPAEIDAEI